MNRESTELEGAFYYIDMQKIKGNGQQKNFVAFTGTYKYPWLSLG